MLDAAKGTEALQLLQEELASEDAETRRLCLVAAALGPERSRKELVPFLSGERRARACGEGRRAGGQAGRRAGCPAGAFALGAHARAQPSATLPTRKRPSPLRLFVPPRCRAPSPPPFHPPSEHADGDDEVLLVMADEIGKLAARGLLGP